MRLSYRGIAYSPELTFDVPIGEGLGQYRGVSTQFRATNMPLPDNAPQLRYWGTTYCRLH
ncbi:MULTISPECIES: DUF4278 domain-containing protein [unclassified Leptolyngbya]|uniref:DUF4278 domain-containing protein n=1 Tax=unclassified Leptolyngbya TaxID=2650499 RepID=UPI0016867490|nr:MULTISPECIES: DUF4278 domain-containing protein [unclassified Leptolyngbya]MBD1910912.1 DUF4278 domain-containing protein [Leptolyngbya sp. FACHB-8]MBD2154957.1 DUF4278 domain-containing protein [Leptolyngbya sp. FACHB-16]